MSWKMVKARRTSSSVMLRFSRLRNAGLVAAYEEDLVALQFRVAIEGAGQQLHWGDQNAEGLRVQGNGGEEFDIHDGEWSTPGISGRGKGAGRT